MSNNLFFLESTPQEIVITNNSNNDKYTFSIDNPTDQEFDETFSKILFFLSSLDVEEINKFENKVGISENRSAEMHREFLEGFKDYFENEINNIINDIIKIKKIETI
ncbi:hypothetical protein JN01_0288 [Entomoplasma freundtii]|uniref:Uncharacterized protein n=1 Tax=Entomoplasma freundtii TaxID=74700 RepID=A0A2K8NT00_9MOLU|nr:hypothetical protein [Entomoplasma freundtii]ATZ16298.1 hypothetical protein EFREU_v1c02720 [Entomoplasma freundtii]TDY56800.1 hypothetical protein JN01_0288 [Entomoplasma freundtii]